MSKNGEKANQSEPKREQSVEPIGMTLSDGSVVDVITGELLSPPKAPAVKRENAQAKSGVETKAKLSLSALQGKIERNLPNVADKLGMDLDKFTFDFEEIPVPKSLFEAKQLAPKIREVLEEGFNKNREVFKGSEEKVMSFIPKEFKEDVGKMFETVTIPMISKRISEELAQRVVDTFSKEGVKTLKYRFVKSWPAYSTGDLSYKIVAGKKGFEVKVVEQGSFKKEEYEKFYKEKVNSDEVKAKEEAEAAKIKERNDSLGTKVNQLNESPLAFLGMIMKPGEGYDDVMQEIAAGKGPLAIFWQFVAGMMGVPAFAKNAEKMIGKLPADVQKTVRQAQKQLPKYEGSGKEAADKGPTSVDAKKVLAITERKDKKVGVNDIELSEKFIPKQGDFTRLEVTVPKGKTLKFKEKTVVDSIGSDAVAEIVGNDKVQIITATIGKGTVIPAGTKLELKKA